MNAVSCISSQIWLVLAPVLAFPFPVKIFSVSLSKPHPLLAATPCLSQPGFLESLFSLPVCTSSHLSSLPRHTLGFCSLALLMSPLILINSVLVLSWSLFTLLVTSSFGYLIHLLVSFPVYRLFKAVMSSSLQFIPDAPPPYTNPLPGLHRHSLPVCLASFPLSSECSGENYNTSG